MVRTVLNDTMPRAMKTAGALAALILIAAGCKGTSGSRSYDNLVMQAPVARTGSGIDPDAAAVEGTTAKGESDKRTVCAAGGSTLLKADGMQVKEIIVDPKDPKT